MKLFLYTRAIVALLGPIFVHAQGNSCDTTRCTTNCLFFDRALNECGYDYINKGYSSLLACHCNWQGLQATVQSLGACTACQNSGLTSYSLETYEYWGIICNIYLEEGEAAAIQSTQQYPTSEVIGFFSTAVLPLLTTNCGPGPGPVPTTSEGPIPTTSGNVITTNPPAPTTTASGEMNAARTMDLGALALFAAPALAVLF